MSQYFVSNLEIVFYDTLFCVFSLQFYGMKREMEEKMKKKVKKNMWSAGYFPKTVVY